MAPDGRRGWWNACYAADPCPFGPAPSQAGLEAADRFGDAGTGRVLELREFREGPLPRQLVCVTMRRPEGA